MTKLTMEKQARAEALIEEQVVQTRSLAEGQVGRVLFVQDARGRELVAKFDDAQTGGLLTEARMLDELDALDDIPSPQVIARAQDCLIMTYVPSIAHKESSAATVDAAHKVAALHARTSPRYGYAYDTLIGSLPQTNTWSEDWIAFFGEHRLLPLARRCVDQKRFSPQTASKLEALITKLPDYLGSPHAPGLIHGDLWGGNLIWGEDRVAGFIDPALYYADPEVEIAFSTMFQTFSQTFYDAYNELRPLSSNFWKERLPIYNLYPLLVHVSIYGGGYIVGVEETLDAFV